MSTLDDDLGGELVDDALARDAPGAAVVAFVGEVVPEEGDDLGLALGAGLRLVGGEGLGEGGLLLAVVADADLDDARDAVEVVDYVVHDRGVGPGEALEGGAEVHVGVDLEDADARVAFGDGLVEPVGDAVLAPDEARDLAVVIAARARS
jgi:hypothetical protein